jgi:hypothetical protein
LISFEVSATDPVICITCIVVMLLIALLALRFQQPAPLQPDPVDAN